MRNKLLCSLAVGASLPVFFGGCASTTTNKPPATQPTFMEKVGASFKSGTAKVTAVFSPKPSTITPTPPPNGKPGSAVFVAMAQLREESGDFDEAEAQYKKALNLDADHLGALTGYARLEDHRHNFEAATKLYQRALKKHSKDASVHNDMGLCYQRRGMLNDAVKELKRAVELQENRKLYRDNLAVVYVDLGNNKEALAQLILAHGEAVGHYNLAFLLEQRKDHAGALAHFVKAAEKDSSLAAAQQWIVKLSSADARPDGALAPSVVVAAGQPGPATSGVGATNAAFTADAGAGESKTGVTFVPTNPAASKPVASYPVTSYPPDPAPSNPAASAPNRSTAPVEAPGLQFSPGLRTNSAPAASVSPAAASDQAPTDNRLPAVSLPNG